MTQITTTPTGQHLTDGNGRTRCGEATGSYPTFPIEPGSDFGEHARDCRKCCERKAAT